jgi:RNA polymerase sigma-70 factor (ECF subfamily)
MVSRMTMELTDAPPEEPSKKGLETLYRKYNQALHRFLARSHAQRDDVPDIVQETYYRVLNSGGLERIRYPRAFLLRVAHNVALNVAKHRRTAGDHDAVDVSEVEIEDEQPSPYRRLKAEQEVSLVRAALAELSPKCREVFVLNRFEYRTYGQIAQELGLSVSMIEKYVSQALAHLRKRLAEPPQ